MCHRQELVLIAVALMAASILKAVSSTATNSANLTGDDVAKTAYDVLEQNNLPRGLLPLGVKSYVLHPGGAFQVEFAWLGINQVSRAGDQLNIQLEKSTQSFPVSAFAQSARCS